MSRLPRRFKTLCWLAAGLAWAGSAAAQPAPPPANVLAAEIVEREIAAGQTLVGAAIPSRRSVIGSAVDGRVVELFVNDGEAVEFTAEMAADGLRGAPIAQLLTDTISIEIAALSAEQESRRQELAELEAGSRPEEIAQAKARLGAANALADFARARFTRAKMLFEQGKSLSREEFEENLSASLAAEQNQIAAQAAYDLAVAGPRAEAIAQAKARLAAATEQVNKLASQKAKYTIRAPFGGYVAAKHTEVGAWVSAGSPIAELVALDPIEVEVAVPELYIAHVRLGAETTVRFDALPEQTFVGRVVRIVPQADLRSRAFPVKVQLANPRGDDGHVIKAGMLARATLAVGPLTKALMAPKDALVLGGPQPVVMCVTPGGRPNELTARPVPVQLGVAQDGLVQVIGDLTAGQHVVVIGNERLRPGQPIQIVAERAAANAAAAAPHN